MFRSYSKVQSGSPLKLYNYEKINIPVITNVSDAITPAQLRETKENIIVETMFNGIPTIVVECYNSDEEIGYVVFQNNQCIGEFTTNNMYDRASSCL